MKLNCPQAVVSVSLKSQTQNRYQNQVQELQAYTWVKLRVRLNPYSHDEALLLCQQSETHWVVWIPDYGEAILDQSQFGEAC
jgi:hypothetical protein